MGRREAQVGAAGRRYWRGWRALGPGLLAVAWVVGGGTSAAAAPSPMLGAIAAVAPLRPLAGTSGGTGSAAPAPAAATSPSTAGAASEKAAGAPSQPALPTTDLQALEQAYAIIRQAYAGPVHTQQLVQGALTGMVAALGDPFSSYLPPSVDRAFVSSLEGFGGIGAELQETAAGPVINTVEAGGPAYNAGLRSGDLIVAVDSHSTRDASLSEVVGWLRGRPGTEVQLQVMLPGKAHPVKYVLKRELLLPPTVFAEMPQPGIGYLRISAFTADTAKEFDRQYARLQQEAGGSGLKGLILDLRDNGGGFVNAAIHIADVLAPAGPLLKIVNAQGQTTEYKAPVHPPAPPIVVLTNGGTASAAEILAGVLQYRHVALLVGTRTYGKGSVQDLFDLPGGGGLKITVAHDELPNGQSWNGIGLQPNVTVTPPPPPWSRLPTFTPVENAPLVPGSIGLQVLGLQQRLAFLGYDPGPQNGVYDPATEAAVRAFQKAAGLTVTGRVDTNDWKAIEQAVAQHIVALKQAPLPDVVLSKGLQVLDQWLRHLAGRPGSAAEAPLAASARGSSPPGRALAWR